MKRKVAKVSTLRLSPNEEALILQQERERRRKLRLQQVREQEKFIAQQIRQDVKERRDQQLQLLAEDLRAKWEAAQAEKLQDLEKIYLCTLNAIGEGHRQAKENEPDLKAIEKTVAANKEKAEKRHREALKELKQHREKQLRSQSWHTVARKKALDIERERAAKIASLPPPPPDPLQNIEVAKRLPLVKVCNVNSFSASHYHLPEAYVDREMDTEQTDARSAALEEEKRLNALQQEEERDRREQLEKATLRGSHALKMVHLAQDRDRLMTELEHMQQEDLSRRRQIVAKMPQQLFEPAYRRAEIREEWQRELETAFEDMYTRNAKMRGDMVLHLKPQPLPDPSVTSVDEDLDLTVEPEGVSGAEHHSGGTEDVSSLEEHREEAREPQSKQVLKRLLNRIRTQKDQWHAKAETADEASDALESGSLPIHQESADGIQEEESKSAVDSNEVTDNTVLAGKSVLLHPQEKATRSRMEAERKQKMEDLERQKQEQLELISKLEEERRSLEEEFRKMRLQVQEEDQERRATAQEDAPEPAVVDGKPEESAATVTQLDTSAESLHIQMIREYQRRLIEQNRVHQQSVDEARKRLQEYQLLLKNRYPHLSTSNVESPDKGQENAGLQRPQPSSSGHHPSAVLSSASCQNALVSLPGPSPPSGKQKSGHSMSQGQVKTRQTSPGIDGPSRQKFEPFPSSSSDLHEFRTESPVSMDSHPHVLGGISPQGLLSHSPTKDGPVFQDSVIGLEKLSSTSSPGEHDSSSGTSYLRLPSALSLDLPPVDFSEPSLSLTVPEVSRRDPLPLGDFSNVQEFRERLLSSAAEIRHQQDHLKEMQVQLDNQRDSLLSKQKSQEQNLVHKQKELEEQIRRHQESLEKLLGSTEPRQATIPADLLVIPERERHHFMSALLKALDGHEEDVSMDTNFDSSNGSLLRPPGKDHKWRPSKPPVTKTKLGPFLQQHELSAIMEVETPSGSGRWSSTGGPELKEGQPGRNDRSGRGESVGYHPDISKMSSDSTRIQEDLSTLSASIKDETPDQSRAKLSWRETLSLEGAHDLTGDRSLTPVLHRNLHELLISNRRTFPRPLSMEEGASGPGPTGQGRSPDSVSDYLSTTTISSGSFLTSEKTESSPGNSDVVSDLQRCNYSAIAENKVPSSSPPTAEIALPTTTWSSYLSPAENRSHIQQIIEKYTKDFSASLERNLSFRSPEVVTDISAIDHQLSNSFHSLEPKPDFSISTPSYAQSGDTRSSQNMADLSQISSYTSCPEELSYGSPASCPPRSALALSSSVSLFPPQNMGRSPNRRQKEADSSGFFLPLHPECTLNEPNMSSYEEPSPGVSGEEQEHPLQHEVSDSSNVSRQHDASLRAFTTPHNASLRAFTTPHDASLRAFTTPHDASLKAFTSPRSSTVLTSAAEESGSFHELFAAQVTVNDSEQDLEHPLQRKVSHSSIASRPHDASLRAFTTPHDASLRVFTTPHDASLRAFTCPRSSTVLTSAAEESGSFHELVAAQVTVNDSELSEHPMSESLERNSVKSVHFEELPAVLEDQCGEENADCGNPQDPDEGSSRPASQSSDQTPRSENLSPAPLSRSSLHSLSSLTIGSSAGSLHTWDSELMRGILEEPDLTLLSLNDSSIVSAERAVTPTADHRDGDTSQSTFHPLRPEVDASGLHAPEQSSAEMSLEFTFTPGSLQEAFLRKKRHFIENSSKRIQDIKKKDRIPKQEGQTSNVRDVSVVRDEQQSSSEMVPSDGGQLKKVVEVRVCAPEDRRLSEIEMHQRTVRLYNRLDEVKTRKEEKMRQETYAKNRQKAKEFKKRTLERLRAKR